MGMFLFRIFLSKRVNQVRVKANKKRFGSILSKSIDPVVGLDFEDNFDSITTAIPQKINHEECRVDRAAKAATKV